MFFKEINGEMPEREARNAQFSVMTHCKDCNKPLSDHGMCKCGAFYCKTCERWGHCSDLGSVMHHEHKGLSEPWGIKGNQDNLYGSETFGISDLMTSTFTYTLEYEDPLFVRDLGDACCLRPDPRITTIRHARVFAPVPELADPSFKPAFICVTVIVRSGDLPPWVVRVIVDLNFNELLPWDFDLNPHKCHHDTPDSFASTSTIPVPYPNVSSVYAAMRQDGLHTYVPIDELLRFIRQSI